MAIGVGVGVPLGLLLVAILGALLYRERRLRRNAESNAEILTQRSQQVPAWAPDKKLYLQGPFQEIDDPNVNPPAELATKQIHEIGK